MTQREEQLTRALRDLLMERSLYTENAARNVLGICLACNRDRSDPCSLCADGENENMRNSRHDDEYL